MIERINKAAGLKCRLQKDQLVIVGVSGGADSLCLLDTLHRLGFRLLVAHFDHRLRPSSTTDAQSVVNAAIARNIPYVCESADVAVFASQNHLSIEEAARKLRYQYLFHTARVNHAQAVAVGHTADDQVETVLMHLLRGSGLAGLKGMTYRTVINEWDASIPVVRPLLDIWRKETHTYCLERGITPVEDISNLDTTYLRNRLRLKLIPTLEDYNPQVRQAIFKMSQTLASDWTVLDREVEAAWQHCLVVEGTNFVAVNSEELLELPPGLQNNLVRRMVTRIDPGLRDFNQEKVENVLAFLYTPTRSHELALSGKIQARLVGNIFYLLLAGAKLPGEDWPQLPEGYFSSLNFPGEVHLADGWFLQLKAEPYSDQLKGHLEAKKGMENQIILPDQRGYEAWLDEASLNFPLVLRRHRKGERWQPLGMQVGSIKLSDFFTNVKLPRQARAGWPVLFSAENAVWLPGFRPGQLFRVQQTTTALVHVLLVKDG